MESKRTPTPEEILASQGFDVTKLKADPDFLQETLVELRGTLAGYNQTIVEARGIIDEQQKEVDRSTLWAEKCRSLIDLINKITTP